MTRNKCTTAGEAEEKEEKEEKEKAPHCSTMA